MTCVRLLPLLLFGAWLAPGAARGADLDAQRSAWRYRRPVTLEPDRPAPPGAGALAAVPVPPEVAGRAQPGLRDLRLVAPDGGEVPYVIDRREERREAERFAARLADTSSERRVRTVWVADLGEGRRFDAIELDIRERDFAKRLTVEASGDGRAFRVLLEGAGVFDQPWALADGGRVHHTTLALPGGAEARYLRLTADDRRSAPVTLKGVRVTRARLRPGERWQLAAPLTPLPGTRGRSRYRVDAPAGLPLAAVVLHADDPVFGREVHLSEEVEGGAARSLGRGLLFRVHLRDAAVDGERLELPVAAPGGGRLVLEIEDRDSPPLRGVRLTLVGTATRLVFPAAPALTLYYGNAATRGPSYDLELLREALTRHGALPAARLGPEAENPRFQPAPPLEGVMSLGAPIPLERWRYVRRLERAGREDLYGLDLDPTDLGALRDDLGDLRIADGQGRQIPYVLEPAVGERALPLRIESEAPSRGRSRYRLRPRPPEGHVPGALPLVGLELEVAEGLFTRPARVLGDLADGEQRQVATEVLTRREGALRLALPPGRYRAVVLEVDDGDNAPLTLRSARGLTRLPRVAFKLRPDLGECRVLLGNPEAGPPRYDIEALRREVLAYAAVPLRASPLHANPAYRPRPGDFVRSRPAAAILWSTLILSVAALLLLLARLLRRHPP